MKMKIMLVVLFISVSCATQKTGVAITIEDRRQVVEAYKEYLIDVINKKINDKNDIPPSSLTVIEAKTRECTNDIYFKKFPQYRDDKHLMTFDSLVTLHKKLDKDLEAVGEDVGLLIGLCINPVSRSEYEKNENLKKMKSIGL